MQTPDIPEGYEEVPLSPEEDRELGVMLGEIIASLTYTFETGRDASEYMDDLIARAADPEQAASLIVVLWGIVFSLIRVQGQMEERNPMEIVRLIAMRGTLWTEGLDPDELGVVD